MSEKNITVGFDTTEGFELLQRQAKMFASSKMVPKIYEGNVSDCAIALDIAARMRANPLMVMQNLYVVHGTPGWSAKFLIATINVCGKFSSLEYEIQGDDAKEKDYRVRAFAKNLSTGQTLYGTWVGWDMVEAEGWHSKNGSKWKTMPAQMFLYRAASFWQRAYCPEIGMGFMTAEDIEDYSQIAERTDRPKSEASAAERMAMMRPKQAIEAKPAEPLEVDFDLDTGEIPVSVMESVKARQYAMAEPPSQAVDAEEAAAAYRKKAKGD